MFQNRYLLLRDRDWKKIFREIREDPNAFSRYYPMVRIQIRNQATRDGVTALITNDEVYAHFQELERKSQI